MPTDPFPVGQYRDFKFIPHDYTQTWDQIKKQVTFTATLPTSAVVGHPPGPGGTDQTFNLQQGDTVTMSSDGSITIDHSA